MNSPVIDFFLKYIVIDRISNTPMYVQMSFQIINLIKQNFLKNGDRMPSTRTLANLLNLHRNTVTSIYNELAAQGWITIIPKKGAFVVNKKKSRLNKNEVQQHDKLSSDYCGFPIINSQILATNHPTKKLNFKADDGLCDSRLFPLSSFSKYYTSEAKKTPKENAIGHHSISFLKKQVANYLNVSHNTNINPKDLVIAQNKYLALYTVAQILLKPQDVIIVGELENSTVNKIFQQTGASIITIPIDKQGLIVDEINKYATKHCIRAIYCNTTHQYPTTVTMSLERRKELMSLAQKYSIAIIEDEPYSPHQYESNNIPNLSKFNFSNNLIQIGTIGYSINTSFQTSFIIAPQKMINEINNYFEMIIPEANSIQERVLATLIYEGEIYRLQKKAHTTYKNRRDYFCNLLKLIFGNEITVSIPTNGLAVWIQFSKNIPVTKIAQNAELNNLDIPYHLLYHNQKYCGIRIGFAQWDEMESMIIVKNLKLAYDKAWHYIND